MRFVSMHRTSSFIAFAAAAVLALLVPPAAGAAEDASSTGAPAEDAATGAAGAGAVPPGTDAAKEPDQGKLQIAVVDEDKGQEENESEDEEEDEHGHGHRSKNSVVLFGESKVVEEGEIVRGDVVVVGGDLAIYGSVSGDAVCVGGKLTLGPKAVIRGDAVNVGGKSDIDPAAEVRGDRVNVMGFPIGPILGLKHLDKIGKDLHERRGGTGDGFASRLAKLVSELVFFLFLLFLALLVTVFMPRQLGRIDEHLAADFPRSALLGVAVMVLLPLAILILAVTIIGIPIIPLLLLAVAVTCLMGYIAFGKVLGRRLVGEKHVMLQILVGLALLQGASILGDLISLPGGAFSLVAGIFKTVGAIIFIGGCFLGLGAVVYSRWGRRTLAQTQAARTPNGSAGTAPTNPTPV
jgi:hypothetical protein